MQQNYSKIMCEACENIPSKIGWELIKKPITHSINGREIIMNETFVIITCSKCGAKKEI